MSDAEYSPSMLVIATPDLESLALAVQDNFTERGFEVDTREELFRVNEHILEALLNRVAYYDSCVVLLPDDAGPARADAAFELGLFFGRLGPYRAFPIVPRGSGLLGDWAGIAHCSFDPAAEDPAVAVRDACDDIATLLADADARAGLTMLPSTALAIGYYRNFLERVVTAIGESPTVRVQRREGGELVDEAVVDLTRDELVIEVRVPRDLGELAPGRFSDRTAELGRVSVSTEIRSFPFYVDAEVDLEAASVRLVDFPTTLSAASYALDAIFGNDPLVRRGSPSRRRLEAREIENFARTLRALLPDPREARFFRFTVVD